MTQNIRKFPWPFKILGACLVFLVFLIGAEMLLNLLGTEFYYKNQFFPINRDINFPEIYEKDPHLFWRFRHDFDTKSTLYSELSYHINSIGLRGSDVTPEKTGYRVLALGNSCTFGWGIEDDLTLTKQLEKILARDANRTDIEVINGGIPGYSSYQGKLLFANELISLKPDMVLIMYAWNDHWPAGRDISDSQQQPPSTIVLKLQNTLSRLKLYQLVRKVILSTTERQKRIPIDDLTHERRVPRKEFIDNLAAIIQLARDNGASPVLLVPPIASFDPVSLKKWHQLIFLHGLYETDIRRTSERLDIPLVDLQVKFDMHNDLFDEPSSDPIHFNEKGHRLAAESIAETVLPLVIEP